ncbi:MAG: LysR family transcriptional regulator [Sphingosinicella sp.]|nr:LysR family transcriptional regulator [Sphingosinicella sp.]
MHSRIDWTDLQYALVLARRGSLASAARALGISHTTILRRVAALETSQGVRLFDRLPSGYKLTAGGEEMLAAAQEVADAVTDLERRLAGQDLRLEGLVRITTTDTLMASLLPRILFEFQELHPAVRLEITTSTDLANLARRDADVAIRVSSNPPDHLVGRRIASVGQAIYQSRDDARPRRGIDILAKERWVGPSEALRATNIARWMNEHVPDECVMFRASSLSNMAEAAAGGLGLAALPCYYGDSLPGLRRASVKTIGQKPQGDLWVLTHPDLRNSARIRAFTAYVGDALALTALAIKGNRDQPHQSRR